MFDTGSIVGRIVLDKSGFDKAVQSVRNSTASLGQGMTDLGKSIYMTSRQIGQVGRNLTFLGAGIITPLMATFKSAEKYSNSVRIEMERLTNVTIQMRVSIAESLVPIMHDLSNILADLTNRWMSLSPQLRESILRTTFMAGAMLALGGTIIYLVAKIGMLVGGIIRLSGALLGLASAHPMVLLLIAAFIALGVVMWNMKSISVPALNAIEIGVNMVVIGYEKAVRTLILWMETSAKFWGKKDWGEWLEGQKKALDQVVTNYEQNIQRIMETGSGQYVGEFENLKSTIKDIGSLFKDIGKTEFNIPDKIYEATKSFGEGWSDTLRDTIHDLTDWGKMAGNIVQQISTNMQTIFSTFFQNIFKGDLESAKEIFADFGNFVLKILADVIAQMVTVKILSGIGNMFSGYTATVQGMGTVPVAPPNYYLGHAEGIENVPYTGLYKLHTDEQVVPAYETGKERSTPLTIYNMITPEAVAMAMASKEGSGVIINVINTNSLRNGVIRREVKNR